MSLSELLVTVVTPWIITMCLVLALGIGLWMVLRSLKFVLGFTGFEKLLFVIAITLGVFVRFWLVPNTMRIYFDEDRYLTYSVSFAKYGKANGVDIATQEKNYLGKPDQALRITVPTINSWALKFFGYQMEPLFIVAKLFSLIQILVFYCVAYLLTKNARVAGYGALGLAVLPTVVYWSTSTALDNYFSTFCIWTLLAALVYVKRSGWVEAVWFAAVVFLMLCVRFEGVVFLPAVGVLAWRQMGKNFHWESVKRIVLVISPLVVFRLALSISVLGKKWCCAEALPLEAFSIEYFFRNLLQNIYALFGRREWPWLLSVIALFGIHKSQRSLKVGLLLWFGVFFVLYSLYYAGMFFSYQFSGSYGRYFLSVLPPFLLFAVIGVDAFLQWMVEKGTVWVWIVAFGLVAISFWPSVRDYPTLVSVSPYYKLVEEGPILQHRFLTDTVLPLLPPRAILIHNLNARILMAGFDAVFYGTFMDEQIGIDFVADRLKEGREVFMLDTGQCFLFPKRCELPLKFFDFEPYVRDPQMPVALVKVLLKK